MKIKININFFLAAMLLLASCEPVDENAPLNLSAQLTYKLDGQFQKRDFATAYIYEETYNISLGSGFMFKLTGSDYSNAFSIVINAPNKIAVDTWYTNTSFYNTGNYFTFRNTGNEFASNKNPLGLQQSFKCKFTELTLDKGTRSRYNVKGNFEAVVYYQPNAATVEKLSFTEGEFTVSGSK